MATEDYAPRLIVLPVYGFQPSASTQNMTSAYAITDAIKGADASIPILMTGTHPAALPERTMKESSVDFVCDREGPVTIWKTLEALIAGEIDFETVPSLWWREADGRIRGPREMEGLVDDLDTEMPGIAWDLLPMDRYRAHNWHSFESIEARQPYAAIHTSLGCPYKCSFCCINAPFGKPNYRMWSPDAVADEIDILVERYGVKHIKFVDEMFVLNKRHVLGICDKLIERGHDINIWAYARVDTVRDEFLEKLAKAGFRWLCLGIESADPDVRDGASKKLKANDVAEVVRKIQAHGINVLGNFIFGLPDDDERTMQATLDMALDLKCEFVNMYSAMAYPGSALYRLAQQEGWQLPREWHHYSQHGFDCTPLPTRHLPASEVLRFRDAAWQRYFADPGYLDVVRRKFGQPVVDHIGRMADVPLPRRLTGASEAA